ncbi:hypothetical protein [Pinirhizobacter sp.]|jgi:hypothetical protein|uniref:hypothetical protein n=1 Tax=Pinirhizobacter sp. TaxID=2950432 RepID=UPI002F3FDFC0
MPPLRFTFGFSLLVLMLGVTATAWLTELTYGPPQVERRRVSLRSPMSRAAVPPLPAVMPKRTYPVQRTIDR